MTNRSDDNKKDLSSQSSSDTRKLHDTSYIDQMSPLLAQTNFDDDYQEQSSSDHRDEPPTHHGDKKKKPLLTRYPILRYVLYALLAVALFFTGYMGYTLSHANQLIDNSFQARMSGKKDLKQAEEEEGDTQIAKIDKPISILIMGVDNNAKRHLESTRTDSMILCTYNPKNGQVSMVSIPRDTYVTMNFDDYNTTGKINSAYSIAKEEGTIKAVEKLLNVPVDYYIRVDFDTVQDVVNAFGGIYIDVPFTLTEQNADGKQTVHFKEGKHQLLNGEEALAYARTRHIDDDIQRGKRQQEVISALVSRAMETGSITKYAKVLQTLNGHIKTDMPRSVILGIANQAMKTGVHITHYIFDWSGFNYNGESFVALKKDSRSFISHRLRVQLGLDKKDKRDAKGYKFQSNGVMDPETYPPYDVQWS